MKKIICTLLIAFFSAVVFISCTDEEIAPSTSNTGSVNFGDEVKK
jgi:hypothetical protein